MTSDSAASGCPSGLNFPFRDPFGAVGENGLEPATGLEFLDALDECGQLLKGEPEVLDRLAQLNAIAENREKSAGTADPIVCARTPKGPSL